ncbi:GDP-mannose dehydrogenase [Ignisphaera sp. 4213-co]|uniref:GDP-mannose dehydrogenase n=1 Tax=Ignisphaera cupida TaxID=3050454 RepID=A0ABD4ZB21_9CREN|nr:GDP-mannose dehydrogenase [Ignisphaera sp. 4213-co]MDK6029303.1 GDP-mannose dehydrogenase [Ignisphaera sp. 4213-co]
MDKTVVIGLGEVGNAIYKVLSQSGKFEVYGFDIDTAKTVNKLEEIPQSIDFMHIAIPYTSKFVDIVKQYANMFKPRYIIIHSTVAPGTTREVYKQVSIPTAFSPVRGKHPNIVKHLYFWTKWIASIPGNELSVFVLHLILAGFKVREYVGDPETLELAKLWETTYRAIMIASWQEIHRIATRFNADMETIMEFIAEVHEVLHDRPLYYPDYIGGHCLIPNTRILHKAFPSKLLEFVLESNEKRIEELKVEKIRNDIEKMKLIVQRYINRDYYT